MYCTLSSLWTPMLDDTQSSFIGRLSGSYLATESFDFMAICMQDISMLLDMNKALLLKLLDFKFLRSYPCGFSYRNKSELGKGYCKREEFFEHYITNHCSNLNYTIIYPVLTWFRRESQDYNSLAVYDFILEQITKNRLR